MPDIRCTAAVKNHDGRCTRKAVTTETTKIAAKDDGDYLRRLIEDPDLDDPEGLQDFLNPSKVTITAVKDRCSQHQDVQQFQAWNWDETKHAMRPEWDKDGMTYNRIIGAATHIVHTAILGVEGEVDEGEFMPSTPYPSGVDDATRLRWIAKSFNDLADYVGEIADAADVEMDLGIRKMLDES